MHIFGLPGLVLMSIACSGRSAKVIIDIFNVENREKIFINCHGELAKYCADWEYSSWLRGNSTGGTSQS